MTERTRRIVTLAMPWMAMALFLIVWELACIVFDLPEIILPRPTKVFVVFVQRIDILLAFCWDTLWTTVLGFAIAIVGGMVLGVLIGASPLAYAALNPLLIGFNSIPKVAIVPVLVIWFGIGTIPAVLTAFLISFFPIVVNVATGIATLEPELKDVLRSLGARPIDILLKVGLPRAMPYFFASLKVAVTLAFVGSVISETIAGNRGIGYLMLQASSSFKVPLVFAGLIVVALMGILMYAAFAVLERRMTGWAFRGSQAAG